MTAFREQLEAIGSALLHIDRLPEGAVWSLTCTNDDDAESPTVLNIYVDEPQWEALRTTLKLGRPVDRSVEVEDYQFVSFRQGTLIVSFIQQLEVL